MEMVSFGLSKRYKDGIKFLWVFLYWSEEQTQYYS